VIIKGYLRCGFVSVFTPTLLPTGIVKSGLSSVLLSFRRCQPGIHIYHHWYPNIYPIETHSANANELRYGVLRRIYYDYCQKAACLLLPWLHPAFLEKKKTRRHYEFFRHFLIKQTPITLLYYIHVDTNMVFKSCFCVSQ
jgi:hypothetical protein